MEDRKPARNSKLFKGDLIKFFERNHFNVVVTDEVVNYTPIIRASRASCHLQIATIIPDGSNRDLIRHLAAGTARSLSFAARCTSNSPYSGQYSITFGPNFFASLD
ncbi:hypothetical protein ACVWXM_000048 [Bradyrhizobium sp. GM7.3]